MKGRVKLTLTLTLRKYGPNREMPFELELDFPCKVEILLEKLGIPVEEPLLIMVNDQQGELARDLNPGDRVTLLPLLAGG